MVKINTGIIGTGKVAHIHASALRNTASSSFLGVYNRNHEHGKAFARQYNVTAYPDIESMIYVSGIQAVIICTPHPAHAVSAIRAMKAGAHVLIEKPLASNLQDCDEMIKTAKENKVKLAMISQRRLYEPVQRIRRAIDQGKLGRLVLGTINMLGWRDRAYYQSNEWRGTWEGEGGGVLVNQAPHQIDILQWFMGPVDEIYGCWSNLNHPYIEVEDTSIAIIRFRNGALGNILVSNSQNPALYGKVAVFGDNGAAAGVQTDGGAMFIAGMTAIEEPPVNDLWTIPGEEHLLGKFKHQDTEFFKKIDATKYYHQLQIENFLKSIIENREPSVSGEEGRKTVEIFTAIYRSQRENKPVKFPLFPEPDRDDFDGRLINQ